MIQPHRRDEGVALLLALLFVILLSAIVVEYCYEMQVEATFVGSQSDELQAYVAAKSAVASAQALLAASQLPTTNGNTNPPPSGTGTAVTLQDEWVQGVPYQAINDAIMQARISDESGKLNLNFLINREDDQIRPEIESILRALFKIRKADQDPTDAIIDWLDANEDVQGTDGAESDTYQSLTIPYSCKNGPMNSIEELLLIKGITPEMYFGDPQNGEPQLSDLLTVHGDDKGMVNINTANEELLEAIGEAMKDNPQSGLSKVVMQKREQDPFWEQKAIDDTLNNTAYKDAVPRFVVTSNVFRVEGQGMAGEPDPVKVLIEAYVEKGAATAAAAGATGGSYKLVDWRVIR